MKKVLIVFGLMIFIKLNLNAQIPSYVPSNGLKAWYPFSGNANDLSGNNFNGSVAGAQLSTDRNGNTNAAYLFGNNQQISIPNTASQNYFPLTISLWYLVSNSLPSSQQNIFSKYTSSSWNGFQILYGDNTNVTNNNTIINNGFGTQSWYARNFSNRVIGYYNSPPFLQPNVSNNTWYHYVFILDSTGGKIFVNGQLISTDTWDGNPGACTNSFLWKIGGQYEGTTWFNGKIDDIGIWDRALTQQEIINLYNSCSTPAPSGNNLQTFCNSATLSNLSVTGTSIKWYASSTGGAQLPANTALVSGTTYYASQTLNGCESLNRFPVKVVINNAQIVSNSNTICSGDTAKLSVNLNMAQDSIYTIGSVGPAGGFVFYDKGNNSNGWRYLEAAPSNIQNSSWGCGDTNVLGATSLLIGNGLTNTNAIVANCLSSSIAAKRCLDYSTNGYDDWFLPSQNEFAQIYQNLILNNLGNFNVGPIPSMGTLYWTSTQLTAASGSHFCLECGGNFYQYSKIYELYVRPIRRFSSSQTIASYLWSTGATTANINVTPSTTTQYWVDITTNGVTCRKFITITVNPISLPTGASIQTFCNNATLSNLTVTGTNIKWYASSTGGAQLPSNTALINGNTYYASQTINGCESKRIAVKAIINNAQIISNANTICKGDTAKLFVNLGSQLDSFFNIGSVGPAGGLVFYDKGNNSNGWRYLEAAPNFQSGPSVGVGCYCTNILNTSNIIGAGSQNSINWKNKGCLTFLNNYSVGGYNNWFLPSKDELNLMYVNLKQNNIGNFYNLPYWTSSPASYGSCGIDGGAWVQNFSNGSQYAEYRSGYANAGYIHLIRQFSPVNYTSTYLWSTGATTATINVTPTTTTQYWVDVTTNGVTCRKLINIQVTNNTTSVIPTVLNAKLNDTGTFVSTKTIGSEIIWQSNNANLGWSNIFPNQYYQFYNSSKILQINNLNVQNHLHKFRVISSLNGCKDTSNTVYINIADTCIVKDTVHDTIYHHISVTDTLIIKVSLSNLSAPNNSNEIKVYPNPAKDFLWIDYGNYSFMNNYSMKISNMLGQVVYNQSVTQQKVQIDLNSWTGRGTYILELFDGNQLIEVKKIILE